MMVYIWIALVVIFALIESATMQLVSIWFAGGAFAAAAAELLGAGKTLQTVIFFAVSVILLFTTRPLAKRLIDGEKQKTNTDSLLGRVIELTESVDNIKETGKASINGVGWTVRSSSGRNIEKGSLCTIEKIEGVKLIVKENGKD